MQVVDNKLRISTLDARFRERRSITLINRIHMSSARKEDYQNKGWILQGLVFGVIMYVFMTFLSPFITNDTITLQRVLIGVPIWLIAGLTYGFAMKTLAKKKTVK